MENKTQEQVLAMKCCQRGCDFDPIQVLVAVMEHCGSASLIDAGTPVEGPAPLKEECSMRITSPLDMLVCLRTSRVLFDYFPQGRGNTPCSIEGLAAAYISTIENQICGNRHAWEVTVFRSEPNHWPPRQPDMQRVVIANTVPVEIRVWMPHSPKKD